MKPKTEVVGIGAAALDYILKVDDDFIRSLPGELEGMELVDHREFLELLGQYPGEPEVLVGGCSINKLKGLSKLGHSCKLAGKISTDEASEKIQAALHEYQIRTSFSISTTPTTQVIGIVAPDGRRTFRTFVGASAKYDVEDLPQDLFSEAKLAIVEGYLIPNLALTTKALQLAKESEAIVSFDLACFEYCRDYGKELLELCDKYVDVLFSNHLEVETLLGKEAKEGCEELSSIVDIVVVSLGKNGCWVGQEGMATHCPAYTIECPHDTTGAGDLFASGFLHGLLGQKTPEVCADYGARLAHEVIQVSGTDIPQASWASLYNVLKV